MLPPEFFTPSTYLPEVHRAYLQGWLEAMQMKAVVATEELERLKQEKRDGKEEEKDKVLGKTETDEGT